MNIGSFKATRGLVPYPKQIDGITIATKLVAEGNALDLQVGDGTYLSVMNTAETIGSLALESIVYVSDNNGIDGATIPEADVPAIKITVTPNFPDDFLGYFFVLRGRGEYKRNLDETPLKIVFSVLNPLLPPDDIVFIDTDVEVGEHYYYSIIAMVGSESEALHFEYNPNTGFESAYAYGEYGHAAIMYDLLPEEWREKDQDLFTQRYVKIFGRMFDTVKTDAEVYSLKSKSIWSIQEEQLQALASIIGWTVSRELRENTQRQEVDAASDFYNIKGRNQSLRFLIQLATGWQVEFEEGWLRTSQYDVLTESPDSTDTYAIASQGKPWLPIRDEILGSSTGAPSQTFVLDKEYVERVIIEVDEGSGFTTWLEVTADELAASTDSSAEIYSVTESGAGVATITFPDGVNGKIPAVGTNNIRASYHHGGDVLKYKPGYPTSVGVGTWLSPTGLRVILTENVSGDPITDAVLSRINTILCQRASYVQAEVLILPDVQEGNEVAPPAVDAYDDTTVATGAFLTFNTLGRTLNTQHIILPGVINNGN